MQQFTLSSPFRNPLLHATQTWPLCVPLGESMQPDALLAPAHRKPISIAKQNAPIITSPLLLHRDPASDDPFSDPHQPPAPHSIPIMPPPWIGLAQPIF